MAWYWPFKRKQLSQKRAYAGAQINRLVADWVATSTSVDSELRSSLRALRNRCRQLERDNDYMQSFLREVENNVVGQGIPFDSQIKMQRGEKLNEKLNQEIEDAWTCWTKRDNCHVSGKLSFQQIERLV